MVLRHWLKLLPGHVCIVNLLSCFILLDQKHTVVDRSFGAVTCSLHRNQMLCLSVAQKSSVELIYLGR